MDQKIANQIVDLKEKGLLTNQPKEIIISVEGRPEKEVFSNYTKIKKEMIKNYDTECLVIT